jgi:hypothetical protein
MNSKTTDETIQKSNEVSSTREQKRKSEKKTASARAVFKEPKPSDRELSGALAHLRSEARQATRAYLANLERDIVKLTEFVHDCQNDKSKNGSTKRFVQIKELLDSLDVKPEKGRRKDLKRLEKTVAAMLQVTDS